MVINTNRQWQNTIGVWRAMLCRCTGPHVGSPRGGNELVKC